MLLSTATVPARISACSFPWIPELPGQKSHVRDCSLLSFIERIKLAYIIDLLIFHALMRAHLLTRLPLFCADYFFEEGFFNCFNIHNHSWGRDFHCSRMLSYCTSTNFHSVGHDRHNFPLYRATIRYSLHHQHYWSTRSALAAPWTLSRHSLPSFVTIVLTQLYIYPSVKQGHQDALFHITAGHCFKCNQPLSWFLNFSWNVVFACQIRS